jgi:hypothetical protein
MIAHAAVRIAKRATEEGSMARDLMAVGKIAEAAQHLGRGEAFNECAALILALEKGTLMAHYVGAEVFSELEDLAQPLIAQALHHASQPGFILGSSEEITELNRNTQAMVLAFQAVAHRFNLSEPAMMIALGATVGTILAQVNEPTRLHGLFKDQCAHSIAEVTEAARPKGHA